MMAGSTTGGVAIDKTFFQNMKDCQAVVKQIPKEIWKSESRFNTGMGKIKAVCIEVPK